MNIFVYGTLKHGQYNHYVIKPYIENITNGYIYGKMYYYTESFPVVSIYDGDKTKVYGELIKVSSSILDKLDYFEGVSVGMYDRKNVKVYTDNNIENAWVYYKNIQFNRHIESGVWE